MPVKSRNGLKTHEFLNHFSRAETYAPLLSFASQKGPGIAFVDGLSGSSAAVIAAACIARTKRSFLFLLGDKESAAYFFNDLEHLLEESDKSYENRSIFFFPSSWRKPDQFGNTDNASVLLRAEIVNRLATERGRTIVVTYPYALSEKVVSRKSLKKNVISISTGEEVNMDFLLDLLIEYGFHQADYVVEPGTFCLRGGIIDIFSFSNDNPFRIEIVGNKVESLRSFDTSTQLSVKRHDQVSILPDITSMHTEGEAGECLLESMPADTLIWAYDLHAAADIADSTLEKYAQIFSQGHESKRSEELFSGSEALFDVIRQRRLIEYASQYLSNIENPRFIFDIKPQPAFNKHFELFVKELESNTRQGISNVITSDNPKQIKRIETIFETLRKGEDSDNRFSYKSMAIALHQGFIDPVSCMACYTDHQVFDRYHRYRIRDKFPGKQALGIKELNELKPGDYITHIDHGIGVFSGLEKIEVNGRLQEAIRLIYKDQDILYISIHSLHRIAKYSGREGTVPTLNRLGSNAWNKLKERTKNKVKDIAKDLIKLYAERKARKGFAFSPDTYLQNELEASFIFEDTPDQEKATTDVKADMEASYPMDRLICGDVGFGKTEIAIRAAFKAVSDSKQVAVLVPTTILALQHFYTFSERLKDFPCTVEYISRFRTAKEQRQVLERLGKGEVDILIGTHRLISKDVVFKDLGLLIIDEEQKFGVATKEKLKQLKVNVDCVTLTATPIPRTLQFSLMGARDLSQINTPPPNRYPIITENHVFSEALIRDAIMMEVMRGGQVFFVHNRVQNIADIAGMIQRLCPDVRIAVGHGQLEGSKLEEIMVGFIHGEYDVLVSTTIIESGLDIPNANTIIVNNAHHFGLSDLHQMRGRVGRTNKKAFCYLITPPASTLSDDARKRLRAIEEFSDLGSGFNIAMRDLDIRGAGDLLGAEQSGFISDIGFDTYHKILDEAMTELRENEFKTLFDTIDDTQYAVKECQIETDLELMIPSDYVSHVQDRLALYKELDSITEESHLATFANQMADRFGPLPEPVLGLLQAVRLRWHGQRLGFEKLILKGNSFIGYFTAKEDYYNSDLFGKVLSFAQQHPQKCVLKDQNGKASITINGISDITTGLNIAEKILA